MCPYLRIIAWQSEKVPQMSSSLTPFIAAKESPTYSKPCLKASNKGEPATFPGSLLHCLVLFLLQVNTPVAVKGSCAGLCKKALARQRAMDLREQASVLLAKDKQINALQQECQDLQAKITSGKVKAPCRDILGLQRGALSVCGKQPGAWRPPESWAKNGSESSSLRFQTRGLGSPL